MKARPADGARHLEAKEEGEMNLSWEINMKKVLKALQTWAYANRPPVVAQSVDGFLEDALARDLSEEEYEKIARSAYCAMCDNQRVIAELYAQTRS